MPVVCQSNLKQINIGMEGYGEDWGGLAAPAYWTGATSQRWADKLGSYVGQPYKWAWSYNEIGGVWKCPGSGLKDPSVTWNGHGSTYGMNSNMNGEDVYHYAFTSLSSTSPTAIYGPLKTWQIKNPSTAGRIALHRIR